MTTDNIAKQNVHRKYIITHKNVNSETHTKQKQMSLFLKNQHKIVSTF